jgi:hypothetical protein
MIAVLILPKVTIRRALARMHIARLHVPSPVVLM